MTSPADINRRLAAARTRADGRRILAGLTAAELKAVAKTLHTNDTGNKAAVATRIVNATVGAREDSASIRNADLKARPGTGGWWT